MSIEDNNRESLGEENHKNSEVLRLFKEVLVGLPIFLIPLFTFLSPANLKQLASGQISPILISLSIFFVFLFICYHFTYLTIKKLHNKSISGLFPVFCFGFYLLFFHESTAGYILSNIHNEMLFSRILSFSSMDHYYHCKYLQQSNHKTNFYLFNFNYN